MMGAGRQLAREGLARMGPQVALLSKGSCPQEIFISWVASEQAALQHWWLRQRWRRPMMRTSTPLPTIRVTPPPPNHTHAAVLLLCCSSSSSSSYYYYYYYDDDDDDDDDNDDHDHDEL